MLPDGPSTPGLVQMVRWMRAPITVLEGAASRFGTPFTLRMATKPTAVIFSDPADVKAIFQTSPRLLQTGRANQEFRTQIGQHSIMALDGAEHHRHRRLLSRAFSGARMPRYAEVIRDETLLDLQKWPRDRTFTLLEPMHRITRNLILRVVFGCSDRATMDRFREVATQVTGEVSTTALSLPFLRANLGLFSRWGRFVQARSALDDMIYAEIRRARHEAAERDDVLARLLCEEVEGEPPLTDQEVRDELLTVLAVGHATTTAALAWTVQWFLASPDVHRRLTDEVRSCLGGHLDPSRFEALPYLDAVIHESLRVTPPILLTVRHLAEDAVIAGLELPAGTLVRPSPYLTHHDPEVFPEPRRFDPGRFLGRRPGPFEYYPFGGGQRTCFGAAYATYQMRVILATMLSQLDLSLDADASDRTRRLALLVAPAHGTPVRVRRRAGRLLRPLKGSTETFSVMPLTVTPRSVGAVGNPGS